MWSDNVGGVENWEEQTFCTLLVSSYCRFFNLVLVALLCEEVNYITKRRVNKYNVVYLLWSWFCFLLSWYFCSLCFYLGEIQPRFFYPFIQTTINWNIEKEGKCDIVSNDSDNFKQKSRICTASKKYKNIMKESTNKQQIMTKLRRYGTYDTKIMTVNYYMFTHTFCIMHVVLIRSFLLPRPAFNNLTFIC